MRLISITGLVLATSFVAAPALAQDGKGTAFGDAGTLIIGAERVSPLFSYSSITRSSEVNGQEVSQTDSTTSMSLLWGGTLQNFYNIPRLAFDYTVAPNITVGGSVAAYLTLSAKEETKAGGQSQSEDNGKITMFGVMPRVGYILPLSETASFWPRVGFSYTSVKFTQPPQTTGGVTVEGSSTTSQVAVHVEPMFVITPVRNFGISIGPVVDIPLTGTQKSESTSGGQTRSEETDSSHLHFGATAGLLGYF